MTSGKSFLYEALKDGYFYNFKYKIGPSSEEDWIAHHYSSNKSSKEFKASLKEQHYAEDDLIEVVGVEDTLSLSAYEIGEQVQLVDYLMSLDDTRTGYLINIE